MPVGLIVFIAWTALELLFIVGTVVWGFETGQWKDIEEPKYQILIDREPEPWPGRENKSPDQGKKPGAANG